MNPGFFLGVIKDLGLLNITAVLCLINAPAIILTVYAFFKMKTNSESHFLTKESYKEQQKIFFENFFKPLRDDLITMREILVQIRIEHAARSGEPKK